MSETKLTPEILLANGFVLNSHYHFEKVINSERFILRQLGDDFNWILDDNIPDDEPYIYIPCSPIINSVEVLNRLLVGLESEPLVV